MTAKKGVSKSKTLARVQQVPEFTPGGIVFREKMVIGTLERLPVKASAKVASPGTYSVWYIGTSDTRIIFDSDWAQAGIPDAPSVVWSSNNGWSIDAANFTDAQLLLLLNDGSFNTQGSPFGPRPNAIPSPANQGLATIAYVNQGDANLLAQLGTKVDVANGVTAIVTGNPADPDVTLYLNGVEL